MAETQIGQLLIFPKLVHESAMSNKTAVGVSLILSSDNLITTPAVLLINLFNP